MLRISLSATIVLYAFMHVQYPYNRLVTRRFVLTIARYHGSTIHCKTLHTTTSSADTAHVSRSRFNCCLGNCNGGTCFDGNKSKYKYFFIFIPAGKIQTLFARCWSSGTRLKRRLCCFGVLDWISGTMDLTNPRSFALFLVFFFVALGNWVRTGQSAHNLQGLECLVRFPKSLLAVQPFCCFVFFRCSRHHHFISRFK